MLFDLFILFFFVGIVSFGGGFTMIPLIQEEVLIRNHWMTAEQLADIIAVAGMAPGPFATNVAVAVGYNQAGLIGAVVALTASVLPSFFVILILGKLFLRFRDHQLLKSSFYGLRPALTGMIAFAAFVLAQNTGMFTNLGWMFWSQLILFAASLYALAVLRKHPLYVIIISGLIGIAIYS